MNQFLDSRGLAARLGIEPKELRDLERSGVVPPPKQLEVSLQRLYSPAEIQVIVSLLAKRGQAVRQRKERMRQRLRSGAIHSLLALGLAGTFYGLSGRSEETAAARPAAARHATLQPPAGPAADTLAEAGDLPAGEPLGRRVREPAEDTAPPSSMIAGEADAVEISAEDFDRIAHLHEKGIVE